MIAAAVAPTSRRASGAGRRSVARSLLVATLAAGIAGLAARSEPAEGRVTAPQGVRVETVARGVGQPTNAAFDPAGGLWVTSGGNVTARSDGVWQVPRRGGRPRHVVSRLYSALGLAWHGGELYVSHVTPYRTDASRHLGTVTAYSGWNGRAFGRSRTVVRGLPTGRHRVDSIVPGPDGRLYLGVGSEFDARASRNRLSATVVSFLPSGRGLRVEAAGLRNPYGLAFIPETSLLLVSDNGRDDLGPFRPPEELNLVDTAAPVGFYGFPRCHEQGGPACRGTRRALAWLPPHSAVGGVAVAERFGRFGRSAFVAEFGSSFSRNPTGGDVARVPLDRLGSGRRIEAQSFVRGLGREFPLGLALGRDGALYLTLWGSGRVVRFVGGR